jgi:hypothetical protein
MDNELPPEVEEMILGIMRSFWPYSDPFNVHLQPLKADWGKALILCEVNLQFGYEACQAAQRSPLLTLH